MSPPMTLPGLSPSRRLRRTPFSEGVDCAVYPNRIEWISSAAWLPDFGANAAIGMVRVTHWDAGTELEAMTPDGPRAARVHAAFWN